MAEVTRKPERTFSETLTVADGATGSFITSSDNFVEAWADLPTPGAEALPTGTVDPDNVSTLDANIIDGNLTNLCYNNVLAGSSNRSLPGVNLGSAKSIEMARVYWWNVTYYADIFRIEYSADGIAWSTAGTFNGSFTSTGTPQDVYFPVVSAQYWRIVCVLGINTTFVVVSELELYAPSGVIVPQKAEAPTFEITEGVSGNVEITNNTGNPVDITTYYNG